ncbi:MAG: hypothetical protein OZ921_03430 [Sorangiineae bacterium]|nr:hypothetical protein [Polyangiaceae bacterium]MEB2321541.1 hypothetical protein [Sorangiineae bacterium]
MERARFAGIAGLLALLGSCDRRGTRGEPLPVDPAQGAVPRGAQIVVEQRAAEFVEGRVIGSTPEGKLRVQLGGVDETQLVSAADVYRLPPEPAHLGAGDLAICESGDATWVPCRVQSVSGAGGIEAVGPGGERIDVRPSRVLAPTPLTLLNLRRRFERESARSAFLQAARRAGSPTPPSGWRPSAQARVLVRRGEDWYSGEVRELDGDTVHLVWSGGERVSEVARSALVPEPPTALPIRAGSFVLVRPVSIQGAWERWKVVSSSEDAWVIVDADGERRSASARDLLPLGG